MVYLSGQVGHSGAKGCRRYCNVPTCLKPGGSHYYPVLLQPDGLDDGKPDINLNPGGADPYFSQNEFNHNLTRLLQTSTTADYETVRRETGLVKPSIFIGMHHDPLSAPGSFPVDSMHLLSLNITDLLLSLWRGKMKCDPDDDQRNWDWAVLKGKIWKTHGKQVAMLRTHLPTSYERPPRDPSEKLNSGYKASEFNTYFYGYLPGLLRGVLPERYLHNFYKLVRGVRIILQRTSTFEELKEAHFLFIDFLQEFEELYVQRKIARMHFVRQCMHVLWHLVPETFQFGPPRNYAQWTIERTIGNLGQEIRLHSNPYANLSKRAVLRATFGALFIKFPELENSPLTLPRGAISLDDSYYLLHKRDKKPYFPEDAELTALTEVGILHHGIIRSARLLLPNGQRARSAWKEDLIKDPRISRMVKVRY